ncbi:MAG: nucleotidyltransferase family protein, partial [Lachnospiraceae bacterium]|nr:nucleotidyltransferase family protein [Lachnospiraceae bacterium]
MIVNGIIAEYNPFHNGHKYQLDLCRAATNADYVIVVLGSNFTQRGEPSILDKFTRAKMALENGADLVIELPISH